MNANLKSLATGFVTALVLGILMLVILTLHSCGGGGSDNGTPIYEDGECVQNCLSECPACGRFIYIDGQKLCSVENCVNTGDGWVAVADGYYPPGDSSYTTNPDTEPYVCPVKEPPKMCTPKEAEEARCIFYDYKTDSNPDCDLSQTDNCWCSGGFYDQVDCSSQSFCQKVPPDAWPPCVCWEFCGFLGEWDCPASVWAFSFLPDQGDGLCHFGSSGEGALGKPGDPNPRYPLDGEPEQSYVISPDGQTLTELTSGVTCTKL